MGRDRVVPRRLRRLVAATLAAAALAGCSGGSGTEPPVDSGVRGVVLRGPIEPVCQEGQPCEDQPFAAGFTVYRGDRRVGSFRSAADGRFEIALWPGDYRIVPAPDAPIIAPASQGQEVSVTAGAFTEVELHFDTGIR